MNHYYENIAASGQEHLENVILDIVESMHKASGLRRLCLAGGVALNCVANQRLMNLDFIDELYIQPAASDAGLSLGAAYLIARSGAKRSALCRMSISGRDIIISKLERL